MELYLFIYKYWEYSQSSSHVDYSAALGTPFFYQSLLFPSSFFQAIIHGLLNVLVATGTAAPFANVNTSGFAHCCG